MSSRAQHWFAPHTPHQSLARQGVRGAAVTLGAQGSKMVLHLAATVILARLLLPADFGLLAMAITVVNFLMLFKDFGLSSAIVQKESITPQQVSNLFWLNVLLSIGLCLGTMAVSPLIAGFYKTPALIPLICALAAGFVVAGLATQHEALLRRNLRFGSLAVVEVTALAAGLASAVLAAWAGWGWWALAIQRLGQLFVASAGYWLVCNWRPTWPKRDSGVRQMAVFGAHLSGTNVTSYISRNADNALIGWFWGSGPLGYYAKGYDLLMAPLYMLNAPLQGVMVPLLSKLMPHPERYRATFLLVARKLNIIFMPMGFSVFVLSQPLVEALLGTQWQAAGPVVGWLGVAMMYQGMGNATGWLFVTQQRGVEFLRCSAITCTINVISFIIALRHGPAAVAQLYALAGVCLQFPFFMLMAGRSGPISSKMLWKSTRGGLWVCGWVGPVALALHQYIYPTHGAWFTVAAAALALPLTALFALWVWPTTRKEITEVTQLLHVGFKTEE